jgi:soluble lytic murein transglycosylase
LWLKEGGKELRMKNKLIKAVIVAQFIALFFIILLFNPLTGKLYTLYFAHKYGLDYGIYYRQIKAESYFRCFIKSNRGAIGIGQVQYSTAVYMDPTIKKWQLYIPWINLDISGKYMQYLLGRYNDNYSIALSAYNWGETNVDSHLKLHQIVIEWEEDYSHLFQNIRETYLYLGRILNPM